MFFTLVHGSRTTDFLFHFIKLLFLIFIMFMKWQRKMKRFYSGQTEIDNHRRRITVQRKRWSILKKSRGNGFLGEGKIYIKLVHYYEISLINKSLDILEACLSQTICLLLLTVIIWPNDATFPSVLQFATEACVNPVCAMHI